MLLVPGFRVSTLTVKIIPVLTLTYVVRTVRASGRHHSRATNLSAMGDNNRCLRDWTAASENYRHKLSY